jgi:SAM-dependent methyltransferase
MQLQEHWEKVYATRSADEVSWFQAHPERSLSLIAATGVSRSGSVIDVGGGASRLVDELLSQGYSSLSVLDISGAALAACRARLGSRATGVNWIEGDVTRVDLPHHAYDVWHDRAVFHFLMEAEERRRYVDAVLRAVKPAGHVIVATFAEDGPTQCSGLPVQRYRPAELHAQFGEAFTLLRHEREAHRTPAGGTQHFVYCLLRRKSV